MRWIAHSEMVAMLRIHALPLLLASVMASLALADEASVRERDELFRREVEAMFPRLVETRRDIHAHPELSNEEARTGKLVADRLRALGLEVRDGVAGHGVIGLLRGAARGPCVAVRADMDALPIRELRSVPYRSRNPGVMHACGHDVHTAVALGVAELLAKHRDRVHGTVKFLFQPAEEAMPATYKKDWGAKLMIAEGAMENPRPAAVIGLHCTTSSSAVGGRDDDRDGLLSAGQLGYTIGAASANSDRFVITIHGKMAHGSAPSRGVDAIAVAAQAIVALQMIRSRETATTQPLVITVGTIQGGQRDNILAERVDLGGTVRTYDEGFRDKVIALMERTLQGVTSAHGATYELDYRKGYPSTINDEALARQLLPTMRRIVGEKNVIEQVPGMGGEDFSYFAQIAPGFYYRLGVANEKEGITAGGHTPMFDADERSLVTGVETMAAMVCDFLDARKGTAR